MCRASGRTHCDTQTAKNCGSEPARDSGGSGAEYAGCAGLIASRLAPTMDLQLFRMCDLPQPRSV
ncbi:hypothetical protein C6Y56_16815 [Pseudomonas fluorescens]|uniref:Uncharacterized protein n=1 Tax=Pseudomonas fluorescens TaxID=294 RepID=A0A7Z3C5Z9_PSEFL|nr:hypothetical protein C6Y56_16815 [Pseudomonas fluorescens]